MTFIVHSRFTLFDLSLNVDDSTHAFLSTSLHYLKCISEILTQWIKSAYSARSKSSLSLGRAKRDGETDSLSENSAVQVSFQSLSRCVGYITFPSLLMINFGSFCLSLQLARARSAGLINVVDNYKSSLETMVGRPREADQLLKIFTDIEDALKAF